MPQLNLAGSIHEPGCFRTTQRCRSLPCGQFESHHRKRPHDGAPTVALIMTFARLFPASTGSVQRRLLSRSRSSSGSQIARACPRVSAKCRQPEDATPDSNDRPSRRCHCLPAVSCLRFTPMPRFQVARSCPRIPRRASQLKSSATGVPASVNRAELGEACPDGFQSCRVQRAVAGCGPPDSRIGRTCRATSPARSPPSTRRRS